MKLFRDYVMSWGEIGALKTYVFIGGLLVGSYFHELVMDYVVILLVVFVALLLYLTFKLLTDGFNG